MSRGSIYGIPCYPNRLYGGFLFDIEYVRRSLGELEEGKNGDSY